MHNVQKDWLGSVVMAALGAGIITSFAVSQGQSPLVGLAITAFAAVSAVAIDHFL
ncbi:hypothetical protein IQ254_26765 [Nodosilinea sp. LEGE 07088]|uniref:hypothetical protein n=1 Tax=Nodosilinea sp. LEGE 07088 TaxID=2777968 RepID=UPI00187E3F18|nr:hypothetical protein [Nodosilinea sp. LEGE 07088]MBE9140760.1 hypothetical protein [Nodosilinea sp. LEGE 07088]